ncbi:MAG: methyltransferase [Trueperaceae bacterium]|nr:methyltransferase [Trueperaceae bacterium]
MTLAEYHRLEPTPIRVDDETFRYTVKPGVRDHDAVHPAIRLMLERAELGGEHLIDATGGLGVLALFADAERVTVLDPSRAALRCSQETFTGDDRVTIAAGSSWYAPPTSADRIFLLPATDRGNARVSADLRGAHAALSGGGVAYVAMHKDQGAKRYEKQLAALFGEVDVLAKKAGWRLVRAKKIKTETEAVEARTFNAADLTLEAEPGVFASGKLDPGTALLLATLDLRETAGQRLLDLGCGYGVIGLKASLAGAAVTALDDDVLAVKSTHRNAARYGLDVRSLHSDVDSALKDDARFDVVLSNPPFHVGKQVRLELPRVFIAAARKHLVPGGVFTLVANKALPYEQELSTWATVATIAESPQYKVLQAVKHS